MNTAITGGGSYDTRRDYDSIAARVNKITYPASTQFAAGLRVRYDFNAYGYLSEVRNDNAGGTFNALYWRMDEQTADGQVKRSTAGNNIETEQVFVPQTGAIDVIRSRTVGTSPWSIQQLEYEYDFDVLGSLTRRRDANQNVREDVTVLDALNRMRTVERYSGTTLQSTKTVAYNALGNITSKSHLTGSTTGTYNYATAATCTGAERVTRTTGQLPTCTTRDGSGNQLRGWNFTNGRSRDVSWTPHRDLVRNARVFEEDSGFRFEIDSVHVP